jgi:hypothetical protein
VGSGRSNPSGSQRGQPACCLPDFKAFGRLSHEIPIRYGSWQQLYEAFDLATPQFGDEPNLELGEKIGSELRELTLSLFSTPAGNQLQAV